MSGRLGNGWNHFNGGSRTLTEVRRGCCRSLREMDEDRGVA
jgi:hypothetical protein